MPASYSFFSPTSTSTSSSPSALPAIASAAGARPLAGKVAVVTGASRGIGRDIALSLARVGCNVVIAAKSVTAQPTLPGTIYTVAAEARALGVRALAVQCDVRDDAAITSLMQRTASEFNQRIDILICNSGALWWRDVDKTPMSRYDLVNSVNSRGTFSCVHAALPYMKKGGYGRIIVMSPPLDMRMVSGKVAYSISKFGMSLIAIGVAEEMRKQNLDITINALWPKTLIESFATKNFKMGEQSQWRKAAILSDCVVSIVSEQGADAVNGCTLIDEDYLRSRGVTDFKKYRVVADVEPDKAWPPVNEKWMPRDTNGLPPGLSAKL